MLRFSLGGTGMDKIRNGYIRGMVDILGNGGRRWICQKVEENKDHREDSRMQ